MSEVNNIPMDEFEQFLMLEDVNGFGDSSTIKEMVNEGKQQVANAKAEQLSFDDYGEPEELEQFETPDWSFLEEDSNPQFEDDTDDEPVESEESDAISEEGEDSEATVDDEYNEYPDTYDVGLETTIALPDGRVMTIEELQNGYQADVDYRAREEAFNQRVAAFEAERLASQDLFPVYQLETDEILNSYDGWDWDRLGDEDPQTYAIEKRNYDRMLKRKQWLIDTAAQQKLQREAAERQAFLNESMATVDVLKAKIPGWGDPLYEELMNHAITAYGVSEEEVLKWNKPHQFLMTYNDYMRTKGKQRASVTINNGRKSKGVYNRPGGKAISTDDRALIAAKYNAGKLSQEEAFKFLED